MFDEGAEADALHPAANDDMLMMCSSLMFTFRLLLFSP